jgi:hypothetical protein
VTAAEGGLQADAPITRLIGFKETSQRHRYKSSPTCLPGRSNLLTAIFSAYMFSEVSFGTNMFKTLSQVADEFEVSKEIQ